jgi:hypothetical protein
MRCSPSSILGVTERPLMPLSVCGSGQLNCQVLACLCVGGKGARDAFGVCLRRVAVSLGWARTPLLLSLPPTSGRVEEPPTVCKAHDDAPLRASLGGCHPVSSQKEDTVSRTARSCRCPGVLTSRRAFAPSEVQRRRAGPHGCT